MTMSKKQERMFMDCIEAHHRMIQFHRNQIIELSRHVRDEERINELLNCEKEHE